jgi:hypothetical protein
VSASPFPIDPASAANRGTLPSGAAVGSGQRSMPTEMTEQNNGPRPMEAPATAKADASVDHDAELPQTEVASKPLTPGARPTRRTLLLGVLGVLVLAGTLWFGIPWIRLTLNTVSTDDVS